MRWHWCWELRSSTNTAGHTTALLGSVRWQVMASWMAKPPTLMSGICPLGGPAWSCLQRGGWAMLPGGWVVVGLTHPAGHTGQDRLEAGSSSTGLDGCGHTDLLLLRPGAGVPDRAGELQHFPQQRLQVCWVLLRPHVVGAEKHCSHQHTATKTPLPRVSVGMEGSQ